MTLYYSLCFLLLSLEIGLCAVMLAPWPLVMRKKVFRFLEHNPIIAKIQYGLKISFIFIAILFVDAVQRLVRVANDGRGLAVSENQASVKDIGSQTAYQSRKFYAQRNLYLTGGTLGLAFILSRTFSLNLDLINAAEELGTLKGSSAASSRRAQESGDLTQKVKELEDVIEAKDRDIATLKSQAASQAAEYDRLTGEHQKVTSLPGDKKKD